MKTLKLMGMALCLFSLSLISLHADGPAAPYVAPIIDPITGKVIQPQSRFQGVKSAAGNFPGNAYAGVKSGARYTAALPGRAIRATGRGANATWGAAKATPGALLRGAKATPGFIKSTPGRIYAGATKRNLLIAALVVTAVAGIVYAIKTGKHHVIKKSIDELMANIKKHNLPGSETVKNALKRFNDWRAANGMLYADSRFQKGMQYAAKLLADAYNKSVEFGRKAGAYTKGRFFRSTLPVTPPSQSLSLEDY